MGHGSFPINDPIYFFLVSSNTFSYIFESIVDVKALLCIFFISCPRNIWMVCKWHFTLCLVISSSLENIPCMLVTREAENTGNSHTGQYSLQTYVTGFWHNLSQKKRGGGGILCIPLFCSDSGQWVFDYDSFGIMAQYKWSFFCQCT